MLAELAQAEVVAQEALPTAPHRAQELAELVAVGVQQEPAALPPTFLVRAVEARLAQPLAEIQTLHTWQQGQD
jgi:hypothetical protein